MQLASEYSAWSVLAGLEALMEDESFVSTLGFSEEDSIKETIEALRRLVDAD